MSINKVDFGRLDAESDRNLTKYFVDTGVFGRLRDGTKSFVIGRKGAGKTALFKEADESRIGHSVIKLEFSEYPWPVVRQIREEGMLPESSYVATWKFYYLISICKHWFNNESEPVSEQAGRLLGAIYNGEEPSLSQILVDKVKRIRRIQLPSITEGTLGAIELDEKSGPLLAKAITLWISKLDKFVSDNYVNAPFSLLVDRLDDGWDASDDSKNMLIGALKAARELCLHLGRPHHAAPIITFLRSDILDELRFNDKNKMQADIERLAWSENSLKLIVEARIADSLKTSRVGAWSSVFTDDELRQRASAFSYIIRRTMLRPRDIISFCINCKDAAVQNGRDIVQGEDIYAAEKAYSRHVYEELDDEMHKQFPVSREILLTLRDVNLHRFTFEQWLEASRSRTSDTSDEIARSRLKILFDFAVVGVPRKGGAKGGTEFLFTYNDRFLEPDFSGEMLVHPSLRSHLSIKELRKTRQELSEDEI